MIIVSVTHDNIIPCLATPPRPGVGGSQLLGGSIFLFTVTDTARVLKDIFLFIFEYNQQMITSDAWFPPR
eukprot:g52617.t1